MVKEEEDRKRKEDAAKLELERKELASLAANEDLLVLTFLSSLSSLSSLTSSNISLEREGYTRGCRIGRCRPSHHLTQ